MRNKLYIAVFNLIFSAMVVACSFICFAWLSANQSTQTTQMQVSVKPQMMITTTKYYYDRETKTFLHNANINFVMDDYDSIFLDENVNLEVVLELKIEYELLTYYDNLNLILVRQPHSDSSSADLSTYLSSIVTVGTYSSLIQPSTDGEIWSSAVTNQTNTSVFTTHNNNLFTKSADLSFTIDVSTLNTTTLYIYVVFGYSADLVELYNQQADIFEHDEIVVFANDLVSLEVTVS